MEQMRTKTYSPPFFAPLRVTAMGQLLRTPQKYTLNPGGRETNWTGVCICTSTCSDAPQQYSQLGTVPWNLAIMYSKNLNLLCTSVRNSLILEHNLWNISQYIHIILERLVQTCHFSDRKQYIYGHHRDRLAASGIMKWLCYDYFLIYLSILWK